MFDPDHFFFSKVRLNEIIAEIQRILFLSFAE